VVTLGPTAQATLVYIITCLLYTMLYIYIYIILIILIIYYLFFLCYWWGAPLAPIISLATGKCTPYPPHKALSLHYFFFMCKISATRGPVHICPTKKHHPIIYICMFPATM
jgi:hypothetical protein